MNEKDPREIVRHLSPDDAWGVLQQLAAEDESLFPLLLGVLLFNPAEFGAISIKEGGL